MGKVFTYEEARALLPEVRRRTDDARRAVEASQARTGQGVAPAASVEAVLSEWAHALLELGVEVKGLWLVDFDNGSGYYCWQYPEASLDYYHTYEDGFRGRVRIH